jgi:alpha-L-rhamnosidase
VLLEEGLLLHLMFTGSFIRSLARMHIPGIDLIGPRPEGVSLEDTMTRVGGLYVGKLASSAAHTRGRSEVMSESFAASGLEMTQEKMIAIANWQFVTGITEMMPMSIHYHMSRRRRDRDSDDFRKFLQDDFFKDPGFYAAYVGRIKAMLTGGQHVADIAMLVPEVSIWANYVPAEATMPYQRYREKNPKAVEIDDAFLDLSTELLRAQLDYDYLDDEAFEKAEISQGKLNLAGESYSLLVLPAATTMRFRIADKVAAFRRAGGRVVACGELPDQAMERGKDEALKKLLAGAVTAHAAKPAEAVHAIRKFLTPDVSLTAPERQIYYLHKRKNGADIYFFINMSDAAKQTEVTFSRVRGRAAIWNPIDGTTRDIGARSKITLELPKLSARFVVFG